MRSARRDRGSAAIWVLCCCTLVMLLAAAATVRGLAVLARHRAEAGADLAALAGAARIGVGGDVCGTARVFAVRNGARLAGCLVRLAADGRSGTVAVRVALPVRLPLVGMRVVVASARAAREPAGRLPPTAVHDVRKFSPGYHGRGPPDVPSAAGRVIPGGTVQPAAGGGRQVGAGR